MKASIIIRAYNAEKTLERAVESALSQDFPREEYEVLIVDDGSNDRTPAIADSFVPKGVRVLWQKNQGAISAANRGFINASGEHVTLLDSDDEATSELLSSSLTVIEADRSLSFCFCDYIEEFNEVERGVLVTNVFHMLAGGTMWKRKFLQRQGWLHNTMFAEYELVLRTWGKAKYAHVPKACYVYHRSPHSLASNTKKAEASVQRLRELYPERNAEIDMIRSYKLP